jgi:WD40 repeat protein
VSSTAIHPQAPTVEDPYVGLTYFTEDRVDFFFGRDEECALIIGNLRAARLTLLYAESGVGKSSVLRAGVVARLRSFAERDQRQRGLPRLVPVVFNSWSERPVAALVHAIGEAIRPYLGEGDLPELPEGDLEAALEAASEAVEGTMLVILDQFEEYFLYPDEGIQEERIAAQIARCVNRPDLHANFLVSIREDSYAQLGDLFRGKVKNVYGNFLHMDFLGRGGAREAIERPLERMNELQPGAEPFAAEPELVEAVLDQVSRDEESVGIETTYLQLVMRRLWEEETGAGSRLLRLQTLERLGGAQAIIGNHLDRAMEAGAGLTPDQRLIAASAFRFLVTSGGTKIALTVVDLADLTGLAAAEIEPILRHLSSPKLHILRPVVFEGGEGEPRFEIFHDALAAPIVEWRTRVEEEEREAKAERERADKEKAQQAAAEAKRQAQQERQRKRVAQALLAVTVVALLAVATYFAIHQTNLADQREADNQSVRAAERIAELAKAPTFGPAKAALASVEAYRLSPTLEARDQALAQLQFNPALPTIAAGHTRGVSAVAFIPGSKNFVTGGYDQTVRVWGADGREIGSPQIVGEVPLGIAVSKPLSDGARIVAAGLGSGRIDLWEIDASGKVKRGSYKDWSVGHGEIQGIAFNPRAPELLAFGGSDGALMLADVEHSRSAGVIGREHVRGGIYDLAFAPSGRTLFVASSDERRVFGVSSTGLDGSLRLGGWAQAVAAGPHNSFAFAAEGRIKLWDGIRKREMVLRAPGTVNALGFAHGGNVLVAGGEDWNVTTWDVATGRPFGPPRMAGPPRAAGGAEIEDLAIAPDDETIAAAGANGLVKLWPLMPTVRTLATTVGGLSPAETGDRLPKIFGLAVGAHGLVAAAGGPAGTSIWSLRDPPAPGSPPKPVARIAGATHAVAYRGNILVTGRHSSFAVYGTRGVCRGRGADPCLLGVPGNPHSEVTIESLALKQYGSRLLLASTAYRNRKGYFNLWDLTRVEEGKITHIYSSPRLDTEIRRLTFSPTYPLLAAGTADGKTRVWNVSDPTSPHGIKIRHARGNENQSVDAIAFSRDGFLLASGGEDQQVVLWRVVHHDSGSVTVDGMPGTMLQGDSIFSLAFSPNGGVLAVGDADGNTCLYEVATRHVIGDNSCLLGHVTELISGGIETAKFARLGDGRIVLLIAGTGQPIVAWNSILWNVSKSDRAKEAIAHDVCSLVGRNLSDPEWNSVFASTKLANHRHQTCPQ